MSWGALSLEQAQVVRRFVKGRRVHDLGAGNLLLSRQLVALGAQRVVAVDSRAEIKRIPRGVDFVQLPYHSYAKRGVDIDVAFVSWPPQYGTRGLPQLLARARRVIYLGCNDHATVCGNAPLFNQLVQRTQLRYLADPANDLIVYGRRCIREPNEHELKALKLTTWLPDDPETCAQRGAALKRQLLKGTT